MQFMIYYNLVFGEINNPEGVLKKFKEMADIMNEHILESTYPQTEQFIESVRKQVEKLKKRCFKQNNNDESDENDEKQPN